jgi:hypothetical protein
MSNSKNKYSHTLCKNKLSLPKKKKTIKVVKMIVLLKLKSWCYISPHSEMTTSSCGLLAFPTVGTFSKLNKKIQPIFRRTSNPSIILPNTTCLPSRKSHFEHVMKN